LNDKLQHQLANSMSSPSDSNFYLFGEFGRGVLKEIRREAFGEDIGQFSWITADELRGFFSELKLTANSHLLDVACGSGGPAMFTAQTVGCRVMGIDVNESGIGIARKLAQALGIQERVRFQSADVSNRLPFDDAIFDAVLSIDAMNHFENRAGLLQEWWRVLRPGGQFVFTDATIVTGTLSRDEIIDRGRSMGRFLFTPPGEHERFIQRAGFVDLHVKDVTDTIAAVSKRWRDAREKRRTQLLESETPADFESLQKMLSAAHTLASERRLSRFAYFGRKPGAS
jgi:ubiquinone/menaquinone biosynthesis C-methylase UbiE